MVHSGYQYGGDNPYGYTPKGATFVIGGVARLHLSDHFRTGFEGYFSTLGLKKDLVKGITTNCSGQVSLQIGTGRLGDSILMSEQR